MINAFVKKPPFLWKGGFFVVKSSNIPNFAFQLKISKDER